jgi:hypothetical protein
VAFPRAVRIPRSPGPPPTPGPDASAVPPSRAAARAAAVDRRPNRAGAQRALRLAGIYLAALAVMYVAFVDLDRSGPGGTGTAAETGLLYFTLVAAALAVGGVLVTLSPVPRAVEVHPSAVVVVEWTGRRRSFPPLEELRVQVVRRYPRGFLSSETVEAVELFDRNGPRTYQLTEGLLPEHAAPRSTAG